MKKENNTISIVNNATLLLAAMVITLSVPMNWALAALLAMVIILPVAFTIVVTTHIEKWSFRTIVARSIALGTVLVVSSSFAMARGILEYQSTSVIPLWIHIMAITYILTYWDSFYAIRAVSSCRIVSLEQKVCTLQIFNALAANLSRGVRVALGDYLGYEKEYLAEHARIAKKGQEERANALTSGWDFACWLARRFDYDADAAIRFVAEQEQEIPQTSNT